MPDWQREIWQAFSRAGRAIRDSARYFVSILAVPVVVLTSMAFASVERPSLASSLLLAFGNLVVYSIVAVRVHRIVLLGPSAMPIKTAFLPRMRDVKYAVTFFVISLLAGAPTLLIVLATTSSSGESPSRWAVPLGGMLAIYVASRFSLVLPSIAIDDSLRLSRAYAVSRRHQPSLFVVVGILPLALSYAVGYGVVAPLDWAFGDVAARVGGWIAGVPAMVLEISVLSGLFQVIRETRAAA